jgi:hypothetical protein
MLTEIKSTAFQQGGEPRPPIVLNAGLNTILGDSVGTNSIGKSTFLMIVDFVFGGDDYITESQDVQKQVGPHTIQFAFQVGTMKHYFSRRTDSHNIVTRCDEKYVAIEAMSIKDFRDFLKKVYDIALPSLSFRNLVTRYFRIYGRKNHDEKFPLRSVPQEPEGEAISALLKLFNRFSDIEESKNKSETAKDMVDTLKKSIKYNLAESVTTAKYKENDKTIKELEAELEKIIQKSKTPSQTSLRGFETEEARRVVQIKKELEHLRRQRGRLESKLSLIRENMDGSEAYLPSDFMALKNFFSGVEIRKIQEIESFHQRLSSILNTEFKNEERKTQALLDQTITSIIQNEKMLTPSGKIEAISKTVLDSYADIKEKIAKLKKQNETYQKTIELKGIVKEAGIQLSEHLATALREVEHKINAQMDRFNEIIYLGHKKSPTLTLRENAGSYRFETPDDTGTGTSYKGLVVFDLSILKLTPLPALVHDSVVLKQIADEAIEKILKLYQQSGKQVFIVLDKVSSYPKQAQDILEQTAVLRLGDKDNALFGRSWSAKEKQNDK